MKNFKKLWLILPVALLLFTACGSKEDGVEEAKEEAKSEVKEVLAEDKFDAVTGVFESAKGNFSINFPGEPEFSAEPVDFGGGSSVTMNTFTYLEGIEKVYMVAYSDVPGDAISKEEARNFLEEEQSGALGSFGVEKAEESKQADHEDHPGLFYKAKTPEGFHIVAQTYLVDNRLYQVEILKLNAYPTDEEIKAFTGTFKLLK